MTEKYAESTWRGKPLVELSKGKLIKIIHVLQRHYDTMNKQRIKDLEKVIK